MMVGEEDGIFATRARAGMSPFQDSKEASSTVVVVRWSGSRVQNARRLC
jgi:hypothetical protein